ncbi:ketoacyl-ACP synthase III [Sphingomonas sp. 1P08PE]|uniref:ketoacyl-ACP synthase III n=1 Tax=Sphingomonas sp. 1P08PE TaxID=554122 RepID=UPI0039A2DD7E
MSSGQVAHTSGSRIVGVVSCVPSRRIENEHFLERFGNKVHDVVKMTGVKTRHWVDDGVTTSDLCAAAAERLLDSLGWERDSVDGIIFVSQTPDYRLPATSCVLQDRLGLRTGILAFDVSLGCSGYPYSVWMAMMMVQTGAARRILLAVGDTSSIMNDSDDRGTALLFGDAGTVTAVEATTSGADPAWFILGTDGQGADNLIVPEGAFRKREATGKLEGRQLDKLFMDGGEVFNFTLKAVPSLVRDTMAAAGNDVDDYDMFLLHQANAFMIRHLAKKAKLPPEKVPINIDRYGNTSSATLPLLMTTDVANALITGDRQVAMFGFGVGYSWAAASMRIGPLGCCETITL